MQSKKMFHSGGDVSRRDLLQRAGKLAAGSLTSAVFLHGRESSYALARPVTNRPQRVVVIGVGHYHAFSFPNYLQILQSQKLDIVGIHDPDVNIASRYASQVGSTAYTDYRRMIETTKPQFVIALGHHAAMPATFRFLVDAGIPFLMEKPWGTDDKTVNGLAELAEKKNHGQQCLCPLVLNAPKEYVSGWPGAVIDCLDRIGRGEPPAVTARDCARAVSLTFDAYRAAGESVPASLLPSKKDATVG